MISLSDFLVSLFSLLKDSNIAYCVLRNYELLPLDNAGADIDILLEKKNSERALALLSRMQGLRVTATNRRAYVATIFMDNVSYGINKDSLQIDFVTDLAWKGVAYLKTLDVLEGATSYQSHPLVRIPAPHHEAIISFFSSYLSGGRINERYQKKVRRAFEDRESLVRDCLRPFIADGIVEKLVDSVKRDNQEAILALLPRVKLSLIENGILQDPLYVCKNVLHHFWLELGIRLTCRPIVQICVLGMDGAGKSTVISGLVSRLGSRVKSYEVIHLKPKLWRQQSGVRNGGPADPHALPARTKVVSCLKLLWWVMLYHIKTNLHGHRNSTLVIWDRYIYDVLVDPLRYRIALPKVVLRMMAGLAPLPDGVVVLDLPAEVAYSRKQEVPLAELYAIRQGYLDFASGVSGAKVVDAEGGVDKAVCEIIEYVSSVMESKNAAANPVRI